MSVAFEFTDLQEVSPIELSDYHEDLRKTLRKFATSVIRPVSVELDQMTPEEVIKKGSPFWSTMKQMHGLGYHTIFLPEAYGGIGLDPLALHMFFEEISFGSVGFGVAIGVDAFPTFFALMVAAERPELIDEVIIPYAGDTDAKLTGCWAITEPDRGSDILTPGAPWFRNPKISHNLVGKRVDGGYVLNGQKAAWVSCGTTARQAALFFGTDKSKGMAGGAIAVVDLDQKGVTRGKPLNKIGQRDLPQGEIFFEDVFVPDSRIITDEEGYEDFTDVVLGVANAIMAVIGLGGGRAAFEEALAYSKERVQGGTLLCDHEAIQVKLANMYINLEAARQITRNVLNYNLTSMPPRTELSMASKIYTTNTCYQVAHEAIQVFGGNGLSKEYLIEKLFRDLRATLIEDGSNDSLTIAVARKLIYGE
ncbi:MAG TPA: acyl-CoA dehydrogenase family protein [Deltaproteobacteria bacterium]|jgi:alkylation response protein AidB-like acyl-CoA dehydrogenase|nr:acyl-CoA dehydrogenase family protein [Deltaproteobacteria bacterium]HQI00305.1 acyl-CoA dehydrogenase family protein [Deltaproteobacteria bacterium]HQJ08050.1 acyl-CoA dehydrogenase family protein [Deltaproteobacteria bacterium]